MNNIRFCIFISAAFKAGKISNNPFAQPPPGMGMPPRPGMPGKTLRFLIE